MSDWLTPSAENAALITRRMNRLRSPARLLLRPLVQVIAEDPLPPTGPAILLCNHVTMMDPVLVGLATQRAVHWMATETLFGPGMLGGAHKHLGALPKTRFRADMRAIRLLRGWLNAGAVVGIFPEGERTWTGELAALQPGIGRLLRILGLPVYTARLVNAYRLWPRWSARPRRGTVQVEIDGPLTFTRSDRPEEIEAILAAGLRVEPTGRADLPIRGGNLAVGLSNLLYACPSCGDDGGLHEQGSTLVCVTCSGHWTVDTASNLTDAHGTTTPLLAMLDTLRERTTTGWATHTTGDALVSAPTVLDVVGGESLGAGRLHLTPETLRLEDAGEVRWETLLSDISNINIEFQRVVELRVRDQVLRATLSTGSAWRWPWSVQWWASR
ncbi:MAG: 1-acyl-sn-glycerol-3-phosphate acyltransferase [Myxococcota bacterium]|jgi:1-acyl-sn-glycerol-3-phosphate acyltransferase